MGLKRIVTLSDARGSLRCAESNPLDESGRQFHDSNQVNAPLRPGNYGKGAVGRERQDASNAAAHV